MQHLGHWFNPSGDQHHTFAHHLRRHMDDQELGRVRKHFEHELTDTITLRQNLRYFAALQGMSGRRAETAIDAALDRLDMRARAGEKARTLNGGHKRRTEIARALATGILIIPNAFSTPLLDLMTLPMMQLQERIALRNAGNIAPGDIYQYIANGGYAGINKALFGMKPEDVIKDMIDSGLRGRGGAGPRGGVRGDKAVWRRA